jgi:hypothetical protein
MASRINAAHGINHYLYNKAKEQNILPFETIYGGRTAFAPVNRLADYSKMRFTDANKITRGVPFIVFNWTTPALGADWFIQEEQIIYLVYSSDMEEMNKITNFIIDTMKMEDRSATNVQRYLEKITDPTKWGGRTSSPFGAIEYYSIDVAGSNGATPIPEAQGNMEGLITLNVKYGIRTAGATTIADGAAVADED